jgi:archaellum biogenesis ATPase FlaH
MKNYNDFEADQLDFDDSEQDRVISQLMFDADFIAKCVRIDLTSELFTGEIRQNVVDYIYAYYERYKEAPRDSITDILTPGGKIAVNIKEDDLELVVDFISRVVLINNTAGKVKQLYDKLSSFKDKQVLYKTISKLNKMKDRIDGSPDKMKDVIKEAKEALDKGEIFSSTESIFDNEGYEESEWLTRFGIPSIDEAIGGGLVAPNLVIIQAFTGRGKTWSVAHLIKMAARLGHDSVVLETEMANKKFKARMRMCLTGMSGFEIRKNMNLADLSMRASLVNGAQIHIVSEEMKMGTDSRVDAIAGIVKEIEEKTGREQKLILIDSPDDLEPPADVFCNGAIEKSKAIFTWLRNYSQNENKCIVVTCQSQRSSENLLWTTSGNIGDDINKVRRATLGISINGYKGEVEAGYSRLLIFKNTHGPEMKACWLVNNLDKGQWIQDFGPIDRMDVTEYKNMLKNRGVSLTSKTNKSVS